MSTKLTLAELEASEERELGTSNWETVDQKQIDLFAEATHDHQWIHVDPEMAAQGPFGTTVAHGYLSLSMLPYFVSKVLDVTDVRMGHQRQSREGPLHGPCAGRLAGPAEGDAALQRAPR